MEASNSKQRPDGHAACQHDLTVSTCSYCKPAYIKALRNFKPAVSKDRLYDTHHRGLLTWNDNDRFFYRKGM